MEVDFRNDGVCWSGDLFEGRYRKDFQTRRPSDRTELANKYEYIRSSILSDSERLRAAKKDHRRLLKAARASRAWIKAGAPA
jgi:hypothetical protein